MTNEWKKSLSDQQKKMIKRITRKVKYGTKEPYCTCSICGRCIAVMPSNGLMRRHYMGVTQEVCSGSWEDHKKDLDYQQDLKRRIQDKIGR